MPQWEKEEPNIIYLPFLKWVGCLHIIPSAVGLSASSGMRNSLETYLCPAFDRTTVLVPLLSYSLRGMVSHMFQFLVELRQHSRM